MKKPLRTKATVEVDCEGWPVMLTVETDCDSWPGRLPVKIDCGSWSGRLTVAGGRWKLPVANDCGR